MILSALLYLHTQVLLQVPTPCTTATFSSPPGSNGTQPEPSLPPAAAQLSASGPSGMASVSASAPAHAGTPGESQPQQRMGDMVPAPAAAPARAAMEGLLTRAAGAHPGGGETSRLATGLGQPEEAGSIEAALAAAAVRASEGQGGTQQWWANRLSTRSGWGVLATGAWGGRHLLSAAHGAGEAPPGDASAPQPTPLQSHTYAQDDPSLAQDPAQAPASLPSLSRALAAAQAILSQPALGSPQPEQLACLALPRIQSLGGADGVHLSPAAQAPNSTDIDFAVLRALPVDAPTLVTLRAKAAGGASPPAAAAAPALPPTALRQWQLRTGSLLTAALPVKAYPLELYGEGAVMLRASYALFEALWQELKEGG